MASKTPTSAAFACSRSWQVSISSTSTPPSISAPACSTIAGDHGVEADVAQRRQLGGGPHGAGHEARPAAGREIGGSFARQLHRGAIDLRDLVLQIVLAQHDAGGAEGVGLDHVAAGGKEAGVDVADDVRAAQHQQFVAAFLAPEVVRRRLAHLDVGAHGAVVDDDALLHGLEKAGHLSVGQSGHREIGSSGDLFFK